MRTPTARLLARHKPAGAARLAVAGMLESKIPEGAVFGERDQERLGDRDLEQHLPVLPRHARSPAAQKARTRRSNERSTPQVRCQGAVLAHEIARAPSLPHRRAAGFTGGRLQAPRVMMV